MISHINMTQFMFMEEVVDWVDENFADPTSFSSLSRLSSLAWQLCGIRCAFTALSARKSRLVLKERAIFIDEQCTPRESSLEIARHLGHLLLHENFEVNEWSANRSLLVQLRKVLGSNKAVKTKDKTRLRAREADQFAAALLVPRKRLYAQAQQYPIIDSIAADLLARYFNVPQELIIYRLKHLTLHHAWDGPLLNEKALESNTEVVSRNWVETMRRTHLITPSNMHKSQQKAVGSSQPEDPIQLTLWG